MERDAEACVQCERVRPVMLVMAAGLDGKPWRLCSTCYLDGLRPMDQVGPERKTVAVLPAPPAPSSPSAADKAKRKKKVAG